jgi:hypothetical protein
MHAKESNRPLVNKHIAVVFDMVKALHPYINSKIKHFQVPHCFYFIRVLGKAVMKYKLFSSHTAWLPKEPEAIVRTVAEMERRQVDSIQLNRFITVGDEGTLATALELDKTTPTISTLRKNPRVGEANVRIASMLPELEELELRALHQQSLR